MAERGAIDSEAEATVQQSEEFPARFGRTGFRSNFPFDSEWSGRYY